MRPAVHESGLHIYIYIYIYVCVCVLHVLALHLFFCLLVCSISKLIELHTASQGL